jgi:hypothetical protein
MTAGHLLQLGCAKWCAAAMGLVLTGQSIGAMCMMCCRCYQHVELQLLWDASVQCGIALQPTSSSHHIHDIMSMAQMQLECKAQRAVSKAFSCRCFLHCS